MGDQFSQEVQTRILTAVRQAYSNNIQQVQQWDSKVRSLYSVALGLVNDRVESLRGYGQIQTALDVRQQYILRRAGPFVTRSSPSKDFWAFPWSYGSL